MKNICAVCGKEFEAIRSTKKYCSQECNNKARRIRYAENKSKPKTIYEKANNCPKRQCLICGKVFKPKTAAANQRQCCYDCMPDGTQLVRSQFLNLLRKQRGGKCERCGYDTYLGALDFHHINQTEKDFTIGNRDFRLKDCIEESKKCVLLCANCHREIHANLWDLSELKKFKEKEEVESNAIN